MLSPGHVKGPSSKTHLPQLRPAAHRGVCLWEGGQEGTQAPQGWVSGHTRLAGDTEDGTGRCGCGGGFPQPCQGLETPSDPRCALCPHRALLPPPAVGCLGASPGRGGVGLGAERAQEARLTATSREIWGSPICQASPVRIRLRCLPPHHPHLLHPPAPSCKPASGGAAGSILGGGRRPWGGKGTSDSYKTLAVPFVPTGSPQPGLQALLRPGLQTPGGHFSSV